MTTVAITWEDDIITPAPSEATRTASLRKEASAEESSDSAYWAIGAVISVFGIGLWTYTKKRKEKLQLDPEEIDVVADYSSNTRWERTDSVDEEETEVETKEERIRWSATDTIDKIVTQKRVEAGIHVEPIPEVEPEPETGCYYHFSGESLNKAVDPASVSGNTFHFTGRSSISR